MADFNVDIPQVGGGDLPRQPVTDMSAAQAVGSVAGTASGLMNDLFTGRQEQRKLTQQRQIGAALADQEQKLSAIADAVDQGSISSAVGRMKARAVTTQAIANNPLLTEQLQESHSKFFSTAGLGKTVGDGTIQEQQQQALRKEAAAKGWVNVNDPTDKQDADLTNYQQFQKNQDLLAAAQAELTYKTGQINYQKAGVELAAAKQSYVTGGIQQANARIDLARNKATFQAQSAVGGMTAAYSNKHLATLETIKKQFDSHQIDAQTASSQVDNILASVNAQVSSALGGFGAQYADDMMKPLTNMSTNYKKYFNGEYTKDALQNQVDINLAHASANITGDPENARVFAVSKLAPNAIAAIPGVNNAVTKIMSQNSTANSNPAILTPQDPNGQKDVKTYTQSILHGIGQIQNGTMSGTDKQQLQTEVDTHIDQVLQGVNGYQLAVKNPSQYKSLVEMLSDPQFGWYMESSKGLHSSSAQAAATVLKRDYEDTGVRLMQEEYFKALNNPLKSAGTGPNAVVSAYVPNLQKPKDTTTRSQAITPVWQGNGVVFVPKDPTDSGSLASARDLNNQVAPALNRMIKMDAHLAGNRNYEKVWKDNYEAKFVPQEEEAPANPNQASTTKGQVEATNYDQMSHAELLRLRSSLPKDDPRQAQLAPYEHQAFAREWVKDNPVTATASLLAAIPLYSAAKEVGVVKSRTPASIDEVAAAYKGIGQGLGLVD